MRNVSFRGFAILGALSTVLWVVSLFRGKTHPPAWALLSAGLACFLVSSMIEVLGLRRRLAGQNRRDDLLDVVDRLTRRGQVFLQIAPDPHDYEAWFKDGERSLSEFSHALATEWAQPDDGSPVANVRPRLERLHDIRRAVMAPGSHFGRGDLDS